MTPEVLVTDRNLERVGIIDEILSLDARPRWRSVGGWQLQAQGDVADALTVPGANILLRLDGQTLFSGPMVRARRDSGTGAVTASGVDDLVWLAWRRALTGATSPVPLTKSYAAEAETAIHSLVDDNLGPSVAEARRAVALDPDQGRGTVGSWEATGQPVLDVAAQIAASQGWGLQVRRQTDGTRLFSVLVPRDRTAQVRLSDVNESIADWNRQVQAPDTTHVYVGGNVNFDTDQRDLVDGGATSDWGRIETWEDARTADTTGDLDQVRDDALADGAAVDQVTATVQAVAAFGFPADYRVGDLVSVQVGGFAKRTAYVVGLDITESDVRPVLSDGRIEQDLAVSALRDLRRRMARQETL